MVRTQQRLVGTATAGNDADHGAGLRGKDLLVARRQAHARLARVAVVGNDGGIVARCARHSATVARLLLDVADECALRHVADGLDVANRECGLLAAVHKHTGVHACG